MHATLTRDVHHLLQTFGSDLTLTRQTGAVYTPSTGALSTGTSTTYTIRGVFVSYRDENIDGTVIRSGDRRLLVRSQGAPTAPQIGDRVGGLELIDVRTLAPNGVAVAWACQARK